MDSAQSSSEHTPDAAGVHDDPTTNGDAAEGVATDEKGDAPAADDVSNGTLGDDDDVGGGLFGSDDEEEDKSRKNDRHLDDAELDSGDDEGKDDRVDDMFDEGEGEEAQGQDSLFMKLQLARQAVPEGSDGELYLLRFPAFLGIDAAMFHEKGFQPPQTAHHGGLAQPADFSRYSVATSSLRWRHSPEDTERLQSNAKVLRWSDGSLTLQIANNPKEQFELPAKPLAPPQINPAKPTPTSKRKARYLNDPVGYDPQLDSHTYLVTPQESAELLRITHHVTSSLTVMPSSDANDEALARLQMNLAAAARGTKANADGSINIINITEDPELAKKKAEIAERDRLRAVKKRQALEVREAERANRVLGRSGLARGGAAGLSVGGLEDDEMGSPLRKRKAGKPTPRKRARGRDSDTDEDMPHGRTREDEYDKNDDFLADSDEEVEYEEEDEGGEGEEEEEAVDQGSEEDVAPQPKAPASPKREREPEEDAAGAEAVAAGPRGKRRRIIEEDDDE